MLPLLLALACLGSAAPPPVHQEASEVPALSEHAAAYARFAAAKDPTTPPAGLHAGEVGQADGNSVYVIQWDTEAFGSLDTFSAFVQAYESTFQYLGCSGSVQGLKPWLALPSRPPTQLLGAPEPHPEAILAPYRAPDWAKQLQWQEARSERRSHTTLIGATTTGWAYVTVQPDRFSRLDCTVGDVDMPNGSVDPGRVLPADPQLLAQLKAATTPSPKPDRSSIVVTPEGRSSVVHYPDGSFGSLPEFVMFAALKSNPERDLTVLQQRTFYTRSLPAELVRQATAPADEISGSRRQNGAVWQDDAAREAFIVYQDGGWSHVVLLGKHDPAAPADE